MKRFLAIAGSLAAGVAALALAASAPASPRAAATGGFTVTAFNETFVKQADGNLFFTTHDFATYTGTFAGTHIFDGTAEVFKDGSLTFHGIATFTGTIDGCGTGTVVFEVDGAANPSGTITRDHAQTLSGKGTLPVHANLDFVGALPTLTYTGNYDC
jgi:hypothetical protein